MITSLGKKLAFPKSVNASSNRTNFDRQYSPLFVHIVFMLLAFLLVNTSHATLTRTTDLEKCPVSRFCVNVTGAITKQDLHELKRIEIELIKSKLRLMMRLDTNGGDVETAIAIGRVVRKYRGTVLTWNQASCQSACIFIVAGGVRRGLSDNIRIHRPYSSSTGYRNYEAVQEDQRRLGKLVRAYLEEMNISPALYDTMLSIPPEQSKVLSEADLIAFGLGDMDIVEQELDDAKEARQLNISKIEFLRRKATAASYCATQFNHGTRTGDFEAYFACRAGVMSGNRQ